MTLPTDDRYPYTQWSYQVNDNENTFTLGFNGEETTGKLTGDFFYDALNVASHGFGLAKKQNPEVYDSMDFDKFISSYLR